MQIGDYNIRYNELHPDVCYAYELFDDSNTEKYSMFTMDGGETFLTSVTDINGEILVGVSFNGKSITRAPFTDLILN